MSKFTTIILRERLPDAFDRPTGWLILGQATKYTEREILAILSYGIGLNLARQYAVLLAQQWGVGQIVEEVKQLERAVQTNQVIDYDVIIQQPFEG